MRYMVNGEELSHVGHDGKKEIFFFTRQKGQQNELIEIPYTFDGVIYAIDK